MLERTIAISARHQADPEVEKLFITVKCPESLLPSYRNLLQFLEFNIRRFVRAEGVRDHAQEAFDGPAPDNVSIEAEMAERRQAREAIKNAEIAANRENNKLPSIKAATATTRAATTATSPRGPKTLKLSKKK